MARVFKLNFVLLLLFVGFEITFAEPQRNQGGIFSHSDLVQVRPVIVNPGQSVNSRQPYVAFVPVGRARQFDSNQYRNIQSFPAVQNVRPQQQQQQVFPQQQNVIPQQQQQQPQQFQPRPQPQMRKKLNFGAQNGGNNINFGTEEETAAVPAPRPQQQQGQQQQQQPVFRRPAMRKRLRFAASGK